MDPVSNLSQLIETLRRQMSPRIDRPVTMAKSAKGAKAGQQAPATRNKRLTIDELSPSLTQRIKAIDPDDKRRRQKATRIILETVLVNEFGETFLADPKFSELLDEIQATMEADTEIRDKADILIAELTK